MLGLTGRTTCVGVMPSTCSCQVRGILFAVPACLCAVCFSGATLAEILLAGEWSSPAFLQYLDMYQLERDAVLQAHVDESDGDGEVE